VVEPIEPEESAAEPAKVEAKPAQQPALGRCSPKDVSAFEPRWTPPAKFRHVCTEEQILALTPCATFKASKKECARFLDGPEADVTCAECVITADIDPAWGPLVYPFPAADRYFVNEAGCIARLDPSQEECAKDRQAALDCIGAACLETCYGDPKASKEEKTACTEAAMLGGCKPYVERSISCRIAIEEAQSPATACFVDLNDDGLRAIVRLFCGK